MGGSEGGREAMMMAQRYPADYDGIVSIDPVMNWSGLQTFGNYVGGILQSRPGGWLNGKTQLVHDTVLSACDALDGISDGVVSNCKTAADLALAAKRCPSGADEGAACFSDAQLAVVNAAHTGYTFTAQSPLTGLNYWDAVVAKMGRETVDQFFAAYVATGLPHTSGGNNAGASNAPGYGIPGRVDLLAVLDNWVERGTKPADQYALTNRKALPPYEVEASKPMCRYGSYPKFVGTGSASGSLAENYTCAPN